MRRTRLEEQKRAKEAGGGCREDACVRSSRVRKMIWKQVVYVCEQPGRNTNTVAVVRYMTLYAVARVKT